MRTVQHGVQARIAGLGAGLIEDGTQLGRDGLAQGLGAAAVFGFQRAHAADAGLLGGQHQALGLGQRAVQLIAQQQVFAGLGGQSDFSRS